jgi:DNA-binding MarR family transcriptional regulator
MSGIDSVIHQPARLRLMALVVAFAGDEWIDFTTLKQELKLTDGNLGAHILKLEEARYIKVRKKFVARRPKTLLQATDRGRAAFAAHREALREILGDG